MNCETCKYWQRHSTEDFNWMCSKEDTRANPDDFGQCNMVKFDHWEKTGLHAFYVMDGSEYMATLTTRRDFGCNQHEGSK